MVLLFNFFIALLSSAYSSLIAFQRGIYLKNIIEELPRWAYHPRFNIFTYRVPPLNFLTFLALPCLLKCSLRTRERLERVQYLPIYLMALALVFVTDLMSLPFAWATVVKRSCHKRVVKWIFISTLLFPLIAVLTCLADLGMAIIYLWDDSSFKKF